MTIKEINRLLIRAAAEICGAQGYSADAEDIAQEAMINLIRSLGRPVSVDSPYSYLMRVVVNTYLTWAAKTDRPGRLGPSRPVTLDERPEPPNEVQLSPHRVTVHNIARTTVLGGIAELGPAHRRTALLLWDKDSYEFDRFSAVEAGRILGVPAGTIRRQRADIRKRIAQVYPELRDLIRDATEY
ncbi:RNA polymerase sigma factor [Antrihabitans spumae]|uniref:RNA polymerase sigma factor n=2 Tax=Antrihabitans spumae TaxID=3373370 RepID=A0ABW7JJG6_9NOCA